MRFVLITSEATLQSIDDAGDDSIEAQLGSGEKFKIKTAASANEKCVRCWHHREDVGDNKEHPELCSRCVDNVAGDGEQRLFA